MSILITLLIVFFGLTDPEEKSLSVKGIVIDKETNEPIPFAHVMIGNVVNVSNIEGEFIISSTNLSHTEANLKVSYMGYNDYEKPISDLSTYHQIFLEPSLTLLDEVVVKTGSSIMEEVFDRFHLNYEMGSQHMIGYYMESMSNHEGPNYIAEGIMDIYTPSNMDKYSYPLVQPLRTRKKVFKEVDAIDDVLGGNASDMAHSSIWRQGSFLAPNNRKNYDFYYGGTISLSSNNVFIIEFEPKNAKGDTRGKLYVDEENLAIIRIEYTPILDDWTFWESVSWIEEYELRNGLFEMVSVSFEGTSTNHEFDYQALLVINESRTIDQLPSDISLLDHYDSFFYEAKEDFSDTFWVGFNFMKLDNSIKNLISSY